MKAVIQPKYGPPEVLQLRDIEIPTLEENRVLVKVQATSLNAMDYRGMRGPWIGRLLGYGVLKPKKKLFGSDIAGRIEVVGSNVKQLHPGDEVFGLGRGGLAEYVTAREDRLALKPTDVTFEKAAAVPVAAVTALQGLRDKGNIKPGQRVLIDGASGGVGTFAVQIAKLFGADVTAVCRTRNVDLARSLRADRIIDSTKEDFTKNGQKYDLIFIVNGYHSIFYYRRALTPNGTCILAGGSISLFFQAMLLGPLLSRLGSKKMRGFIANLNPKDLITLIELVEAGKVVPVIDKRYTLDQAVEAIRYVEEVHPQGKVVITVAQ